MTAAESKGLKKGSRVYWRGDAADGGSITEISSDAARTAGSFSSTCAADLQATWATRV